MAPERVDVRPRVDVRARRPAPAPGAMKPGVPRTRPLIVRRPVPVVSVADRCRSVASLAARPRLAVRSAPPQRRRGRARRDRHRRRADAGSEHLRQAPVHHQHLAVVADHDVVGLQVAVHHAVRVRERDGVARLLEDRQQARRAGTARSISRVARAGCRRAPPSASRPGRTSSCRRRCPSASMPSSWTGTMFGCSSWEVICASSMNRRRSSDLALPLLRQDLHRHGAPAVEVARLVHHAHPALRDASRPISYFRAALDPQDGLRVEDPPWSRAGPSAARPCWRDTP